MELWERSEALDLLGRYLRESRKGGCIALVAGEAGIGKSALVREFARRCNSHTRMLWGACDRLVTPRALGPLHDIGHQIGGRLAAQLRSAAPQEEIFGAFLDELAASRSSRQHVVVVEDAHWADEATLDWLAVLGRRADRLSALLIVTYRSDEVGPDHPLRGVLAALPSAVVRRVPIAPLSPECVREQAREAGRDGDSVYQLAGGNPLLVTELLKTQEEPIPDAVQDLILDRMRALPPPARDLAQLVAVVPTRADAPLVATAADQVEVCLASGVLVPAGDGVSFRHELLRSAVEDSLSPIRRAALHRQVLDILRTIPDADPGRLVHHAWLADDREAVLHFGPIAAAAAARQGAHREATRHYRAATAYADRLPEPEQAELFERYAEQAHLAGANEEALQARRDALTIWERLGQVARSAENLRWISQLAWWAGQVTGMREAADRALQMLASLPPSKELAMAYVAQAQLSFRVNDLDASAAWADRAVQLAHQLGEQEISLHASVTRDTARLASGDLEAWAGLEHTHQSGHQAGLVDPAARALLSLATVVADELARFTDAADLLDQSLAYSTEHHLDGIAVLTLGARAMLRVELGDWTGALADAESVLARGSGTGPSAMLALVAQGRLAAARDDPAARALLDQAERAAEAVGGDNMLVPVSDARSEYFLWAGDTDRAQQEARRGLDLLGWGDGSPFLMGRLFWRLWRAGGTDAPPATIAEPYRRMIAGDWAAAAEEWAGRGAAYLRIHALAAGDETAWTEALRLLDGLSAGRAAYYVRTQLRKRGISRLPRGPRRTTAANAAGLTPRQVDVLTLVAQGLSNADIAKRLTLSPKTVDHHVSALLDKLGVASRGQAAAVAHRLNLGEASAP